MAKLQVFQRRSQLRPIADESVRPRTNAAAQGGQGARALGMLGEAAKTLGLERRQSKDLERDFDYRLEQQRIAADAQFAQRQFQLEQRELRRTRDAQAINAELTARRGSNDLRMWFAQNPDMSIDERREAVNMQKAGYIERLREENPDGVDPEALKTVNAVFDREAMRLDDEARAHALEQVKVKADSVVTSAIDSIIDLDVAPTSEGFGELREGAREAALLRFGYEGELDEGQEAQVKAFGERIQVQSAVANADRIRRAKGAVEADAYLEAFSMENPGLRDDVAGVREKLAPRVKEEGIQALVTSARPEVESAIREGKPHTYEELRELAQATGVSEEDVEAVVDGLRREQKIVGENVKVAQSRAYTELVSAAHEDFASVLKQSDEVLNTPGVNKAEALRARENNITTWLGKVREAAYKADIPDAEKADMLQDAQAAANHVLFGTGAGDGVLSRTAFAVRQNDQAGAVYDAIARGNPELAKERLAKSVLSLDPDTKTRLTAAVENSDSEKVIRLVDKLFDGRVLTKDEAKTGRVPVNKEALRNLWREEAFRAEEEYNQRTPQDKRSVDGLESYVLGKLVPFNLTLPDGETVQTTPFGARVVRWGEAEIDEEEGLQILQEHGLDEVTGARVAWLPTSTSGDSGKLAIEVPETEVTEHMLARAGMGEAQIKRAMASSEAASRTFTGVLWSAYNAATPFSFFGGSQLDRAQSFLDVAEEYRGSSGPRLDKGVYHFDIDMKGFATRPQYSTP